jgi:hypothetical protein
LQWAPVASHRRNRGQTPNPNHSLPSVASCRMLRCTACRQGFPAPFHHGFRPWPRTPRLSPRLRASASGNWLRSAHHPSPGSNIGFVQPECKLQAAIRRRLRPALHGNAACDGADKPGTRPHQVADESDWAAHDDRLRPGTRTPRGHSAHLFVSGGYATAPRLLYAPVSKD